MHKWKQAAMCAAVSAVLAAFAGAAYGQRAAPLGAPGNALSSARGDSRVFEAMRGTEQGSLSAAQPVSIEASDLVRARAAAERPTEGAHERVSGHARFDPATIALPQPQMVTAQPPVVKSPTDARDKKRTASQAEAAAAAQEKARAAGGVPYLTDSAPGSNGRARTYLTEAQRAAEHVRYEANRRRRVADGMAVNAGDRSRPRVVDHQPAAIVASPEPNGPARVEISWATPIRTVEREQARTTEQPEARVAALQRARLPGTPAPSQQGDAASRQRK